MTRGFLSTDLPNPFDGRSRMTQTLAKRVAGRMRRDGFKCDARDVWVVWDTGDLLDRESLASRILQEFAELGLTA